MLIHYFCLSICAAISNDDAIARQQQMFKGHFDTNIGSKLEAESYRRIAAEISNVGATAAADNNNGDAPGTNSGIVFLTDVARG